MAKLFIRRTKQLVRQLLQQRLSTQKYWEQRAKTFGKRAVLNLAHSEAEFETITNQQKLEIFPYLRQALRGDEKLILDFGCGPGRFTGALADLIDGTAIGIDPVSTLIEIAPKDWNTAFKVMEEGVIPLPDNSVDVVWICLVMGGIQQRILKLTINEIKRVLKNNGLLFLVENTSNKPDVEHWKFRQVEDYQTMFHFVSLKHLHDYYDLDERISVMAGRK